MKQLIAIVCLFVTLVSFSQRDLTPSKRRDAFGTRDFRALRNVGMQFQFGPTYTLTRLDKNNETIDFNGSVGRGNYTIDPSGRIGVYGELGMIHFPKKRSKLSLWLKAVLVSYYDWGLGFKLIGGKESTLLNFTDPFGNVVSSLEGKDNFYNGYAYVRFTLHKNINFKRTPKFFLDNSLGVNVDYRVITADQTSDYHNTFSAPYSSSVHYHDPLVAQLHYGLGFGFKLKRGSYLIPGFRTPILGINEWHNGNPSLKWFSSNYWPVLFHVKYMFLFEKKAKGCPPVEINDQDRNTQQGR